MAVQPSNRPGPPVPPHGYQPPPGYGPVPGFGAPPGYGYGPLPPAPPPGRIRPGRASIVLTWVLCAAVTVPALAWGILGFGSGLSSAVPARTFASGEVATVELDPADAPAIYVGIDDPGSVGFEVTYPFSSPVDVNCVISGDPQDLALLQPERTVSVTGDGVRWQQIMLIRVPRPGTHEVLCESESVRFGVANDLPEGLFSRLMVSVAIALLAATTAVVTTIVLVRKRAAARRRFPPPAWSAPTIP